MDIEINSEFADLLEFAGPEAAGMALDQMAEHGPGLLAAIEHAVQSGNGYAVREAAHSLKSSCGALSMLGSAELAGQVEAAVRDGRTADLAGLTGSLQDSFHSELAAVRAYVSRKAQEEQAAD